MIWEEVKNLYPDQYVLLEELGFSTQGNKKIIKDGAIIRPILDPKEATRELVRSKGNRFVYHTSEDEIIIEIVQTPRFRGKLSYMILF